MANLTDIKAKLLLDNKDFNSKLKGSENKVGDFSKVIGKIGVAIAAAFAAKAVGEFALKMSSLSVDVANVSRAFNRLEGVNLSELRKATGGMLSDMELMKKSNMAKNLGLDVKKLGTFFEFAAIRAAETGESVDYLVNSIVTGIGRKSKMIMDNLGISAADLADEMAKVGDFATASANLIEREMGKTNTTIEDTIKGVDSIQASWSNVLDWFATSGFFSYLNTQLIGVSKIINLVTGANEKYSDELINQRTELNLLVGVATNVNTSEKTRLDTIKQIQIVYPNFIGNIDAEKVSNELLTTTLEDVNAQYRIKIKQILAEEKSAPIRKNILDGYNREYEVLRLIGEAEKKREPYRSQNIAAHESEIELIKDERKELEGQLKTIDETIDKWIDLGEAAGDYFAGGLGGGGVLDEHITDLTTINGIDEEIARIEILRKDASYEQAQYYALQLKILKEMKEVFDTLGSDKITMPSISGPDTTGGGAPDSIEPRSETEGIQSFLPDQEMSTEELEAYMEKLEELGELALEVGAAVEYGFNQIGESIIGSLNLASDGMEGFLKVLLETAVKLIAMALATSIANAIAGGSAAGAAAGTAAPILTPIFIATLIAGVLTAFAAIPSFAEGGIVSGPTLGLMGEYPGASGNPEVIAPLSELKSMLFNQPLNNAAIKIEGQLIAKGSDMVYVFDKTTKRQYTNG